MYRTCLYCNTDLDENQVIEPMPIGRRIAFDPANARLWVICRACVKWNLVPFDTRLEIIDACDRTFRETRTRYSSDNIGLARHREGLELIRIGPALRPEYASWRYGQRHQHRRRSASALRGDLIGALNWIITALPGGVFSELSFRDVTTGAMRALHENRVLRDPWTDQLIRVPYAAFAQASLIVRDDGTWHLEVPYRTGAERTLWVDGSMLPSIRDVPSLGLFSGRDLFPVLGWLLPALGDDHSGSSQVAEAVRLVETASAPDRLLAYVVGRPLRFATQRQYPVRQVPTEVRLALEMCAHEETERRAMEGELKLLERQWREADEVAAIADRLALHPSI